MIFGNYTFNDWDAGIENYDAFRYGRNVCLLRRAE